MGLSALTWGIGEGMFIFFLPIYLKELGADPLQIGGILGLGALVMTVVQIPAGIFADTKGAKVIMLLGGLVAVIALGAMFIATNLIVFALGICLYFFSGLMMTPMARYISAIKSNWTFTRSLATNSAFYSTGLIIGPSLSGQVADAFGLRMIFAVALIFIIISTVTIIFASPQPVLPSRGGGRYQNLLKNHKVRKFVFVVSLSVFAMYLSWPLTPIFLQDIRTVSISTIGLLGSINAVGIVVLSLSLGRIKARWGMPLSQFLVGISVVLLWTAVGTHWYAIGFFLAAGYRITRIMVTGHIETLVHASESGFAYGIAETISAGIMLIASPLAGYLYSIKPDLPFSVSLVLIVITLVPISIVVAESQVPASKLQSSKESTAK
jgi:MFS family permease